MTAAEQALKIAPGNSEAHRVLGTIYAALASRTTKPGGGWLRHASATRIAKKAIGHLEEAIALRWASPIRTARATLARLYIHAGAYDKAIPLLADLVNTSQAGRTGPRCWSRRTPAAGQNADAIAWLEEAARR